MALIVEPCSEDLICTPEELHATSLACPSGFLLAWLEMVAEDEPYLGDCFIGN